MTDEAPPIWPDDEYFNWDYQAPMLITGLVVLPLMMLHGFDFFALLMVSNGTTIRTTKASWNSLTNWAWSAMIGGNTTWNGFMWTVWLFSFIKSPFCQKAMFWSFVVGFGLNALYLVAVDILYIVAGTQTGGDIWYNLYMALINTLGNLGYHAILIYGLGPQIAAFYRWHDQDWWTFGDFLRVGTMDDDEIDAFD